MHLDNEALEWLFAIFYYSYTVFYLVGRQWVGYSTAPDPQALDRMDHVAFATDDIAALQRYLAKKGVTVPEAIERWPDGSRSFRVKDPEGHPIEFVERAKSGPQVKPDAEAISRRLIHTGFIVRDQGKELKTPSIKISWDSMSTGLVGDNPAASSGAQCKFPTAPIGWNTCSMSPPNPTGGYSV